MIVETVLQVLKSMKEKMKNRIKEQNANELNGEANREICSTEILIELHDQVIYSFFNLENIMRLSHLASLSEVGPVSITTNSLLFSLV